MQILHEQELTVAPLPTINQTQPETLMPLPKTTGKRIVSKRRYVANIGKKVALSSVSLTFLVIASWALLATFLFVSVWCTPARHNSDFGTPQEAPPWIMGFGITSLLCYFLAWRTLHKVVNIESGVPLTRANTADLPAPDSLVRASEEPRQEPQAVLLRAATESVERHEEQLVRADYLS